MSLTAIILSLGIASSVALYAGINLKLDIVPKGRFLEKFILYLVGIMCIPVCTWFAYVVADNTTGLEYLVSMLQVVFIISIILTFIIGLSYLLYVVETIFDFSAKDEAEVDN